MNLQCALAAKQSKGKKAKRNLGCTRKNIASRLSEVCSEELRHIWSAWYRCGCTGQVTQMAVRMVKGMKHPLEKDATAGTHKPGEVRGDLYV